MHKISQSLDDGHLTMSFRIEGIYHPAMDCNLTSTKNRIEVDTFAG